MEEFDSFQAVEMNEVNISYGRTKTESIFIEIQSSTGFGVTL